MLWTSYWIIIMSSFCSQRSDHTTVVSLEYNEELGSE